jgi:hypothetical protein
VRLDGLYPFSYKSDLDGMGLYSYKSAEEDAIARYFSGTTNVSGSDVISHIGDTSRLPQIGRASDPDGTTWVSVPAIDLHSTDFSMAFWHYHGGALGAGSFSAFFSSTGLQHWLGFNGAGRIRAHIGGGSNLFDTPDGALIEQQWNLISFSYNRASNTMTIRVNNTNYTGTGTLQNAVSTDSPTLFKYISGNNNYLLDDIVLNISLYKKQLSDDDIDSLMNHEAVSNTERFYRCDETSLSTLYDSSGNNNHGTKNSWSVSNNYEGDDVPYSAQNRKGYSKGLIKSTADSWGTGGVLVSTNEFSDDFTFSFKGLETVYYRYIGISDAASSGLGNTSIDYAFYLQNAGVADVRESGTLRTSTFAYTKDSIFKIQRNGSTITYYHNDTLIYTSLVAFALPIKIDIAVYSQNCTIAPCLIDGAKVELADNANFTTEFFPLSGSGLDVLNYSADNKGQVSYTANVVSGTFADQSAGFAETDTAVVDLNQYEAPATRGLPNNFVATDTPTSLNIDNMFIKRVNNVIKDLKITDPDITLTNAKVQAMKDSGEITEWNENTYTVT